MKITLLFFTMLFTYISIQSQVVWSNECDNSSEWMFTNTSSPNLDWQITTSINAAPLPAYQPLSFTTVSNGFFIIDSDAAGASATQNARIEIAAPIDLTNQDHILLTFENAAQSFTDKRTIEVSGDNGVSWTEFVVSSDTNHILYATENPSTFTIDISNVAGGQSQVLVAFIYEGGNDHFWAIDDVKIIEKEENDLQLDQIYFGQTGASGQRLAYYEIPDYSFGITEFSAIVSNQGSNPQNNIVAVLNINNGQILDTVFLTSIGPRDVDTLDFDSTLVHYSFNEDLVHVKVYSDSLEMIVANNEDFVTLVNQDFHILSRTNEEFGSGIYNYGNEFEAGLEFDGINPPSGPCVGAYVKVDCLTEGLTMPLCYLRMYEFDTVNDVFVYLTSSYDFILTSAQVNSCSYIYFNFDQGISQDVNKRYLVTAGSYGDGGETNDFVITSAGVPETNSAYFRDWSLGAEFYYIELKPIIKLYFYSESIDEQSSITSISNFPNPVFTTTTIEYETSQSEEFSLEVIDINGRQVHTQSLGKRNPGKHLIEFDASKLPSGTYIYSIGNENGKASKSMMVLK